MIHVPEGTETSWLEQKKSIQKDIKLTVAETFKTRFTFVIYITTISASNVVDNRTSLLNTMNVNLYYPKNNVTKKRTKEQTSSYLFSNSPNKASFKS